MHAARRSLQVLSWLVSSWRTMETGLNLNEGGSWGIGLTNYISSTRDKWWRAKQLWRTGSCTTTTQGRKWSADNTWTVRAEPRSDPLNAASSSWTIFFHLLETWDSAYMRKRITRSKLAPRLHSSTHIGHGERLFWRLAFSSNCSRKIPPCSSLRGSLKHQ